jgi:serine protease Do
MSARRYGVLLAGAWFLCLPVLADTWYQWTDDQGISHLDRQAPSGSTGYKLVSLPDAIRWSNAPDMPAELDAGSAVSTRDLFKKAARSVYGVFGRHATGLDGTGLFMHGSAVAVTENLAITNCHVVTVAGEDLYLGTGDGGSVAKAELEAANYVYDRCVLRVREAHLQPAAGIRSFDTLEIGESVYAIGNPRSMTRTFSDGLVSGKRVSGDIRLVQTTAPISPGSSGGGLFDARGNLVAITSMSLRGAQGINFAIPAEDYWKEGAR